MSFIEKVRNVKLRTDKVIVVLDKKTYIYNFTDLKPIDVLDTCLNLKGY